MGWEYLFLIINLGRPRKMLYNHISKIKYKARIKRDTTKKVCALIVPTFSLLEQQNSCTKTLEAQIGNLSTFLSSLVLPLTETYKYRREIKLFLNYSLSKIKKSK
jgi:hypothetical protein